MKGVKFCFLRLPDAKSNFQDNISRVEEASQNLITYCLATEEKNRNKVGGPGVLY